jgi:hypothetical protein
VPYLLALPGNTWGEPYTFLNKYVTIEGEDVKVLPATDTHGNRVDNSSFTYDHEGTTLNITFQGIRTWEDESQLHNEYPSVDVTWILKKATSPTTADIFSILARDGETGSGRTRIPEAAPFRAYLTATVQTGEQQAAPLRTLLLRDGGGTTNLDHILAEARNAGNLKLFSEWGAIIVETDTEQPVAVYNADGRLVHIGALKEGTNRIDGLASGIYYIGNQKVLVK